jgi:hypothetical protein
MSIPCVYKQATGTECRTLRCVSRCLGHGQRFFAANTGLLCRDSEDETSNSQESLATRLNLLNFQYKRDFMCNKCNNCTHTQHVQHRAETQAKPPLQWKGNLGADRSLLSPAHVGVAASLTVLPNLTMSLFRTSQVLKWYTLTDVQHTTKYKRKKEVKLCY